jgi:hypothetical protein
MSVNHKQVKQLIHQKRRTITDKQFFTARILAGHFADMAAAQTRRYGHRRKVKMHIVWEPKNDNLAYTRFEQIWINAGHSSIKKKRARPERYNLVCGLFAHELGHILYTDFLAMQTYGIKLAAGQWYPEKPLLRDLSERQHEVDIWDFCSKDPAHLHVLCRAAQDLHNILEDGYIDNTMMIRYPGVLGENLRAWNVLQFEDHPTLTQMIEQETDGESHIWCSLMGLMLSYFLWGELKYGDEPTSDERVQVVFDLLPALDSALVNPSSKERIGVVNTILVRCWPYVKDYIEFCVAQSRKPYAAETDPSEIASGMMPSASAAAEGGTTPVAEPPAASPKLANSGKRAETAKQAAALQAAGAGSVISAPVEVASGEPEGPPEVTAEEGGRLPCEETDELYEPLGGGTEHDNDYEGSGYENAAADTERLLEQMAETTVCEELETVREKELNELANSLSYGNIHAGVKFHVHRIKAVSDDMKEQYKAVAPQLLHISKQLQRSIAQQLKDRRRGGKQTGLYMGRRLDVHALPRNDCRVFYKNALPTEAPELAVALLIDESGSMCSCDRITYARAAAIILYDFCRAMSIPVMVYGHSARNGADLYSYAEFDAIDRNDCCRLMDITARSNNRDGAALRYTAEQLSRRPEEVKILMLISDGQPADSGYSGTAAEEDLRGIQREYTRKGLLFIAAAIGNDRENLRRIYGDAYLDISDLTQLPVKLTGVVKRHVRV